MHSPPFPVVHNHLICLDHIEGKVVVLAPHGQVSDLLPIGCLIVGGDQAYHCCVIYKLNGVGVGHAVMGEQGVQERAENAPLWGPSVEDQQGGDVVSYPHHLGWPVRKSRTQFQRAGFRPRASSLMMSLEGTMVLNAEL